MDATALFNLSYGVYVVGVQGAQRDGGCVINAAIQVSSQPMSIAVSINKENDTYGMLMQSGRFTLSILSEETNPAVVGTFGFHKSGQMDKFAGFAHGKTEAGIPYLSEKVCGYLECAITGSIESHTHTVFLADIVDAKRLDQLPPMTYSYYHKVVKGKTPKTAATYIEVQEESSTEDSGKKAYECEVCHYRMELSEEEFAALPEDFTCPICGEKKARFHMVGG